MTHSVDPQDAEDDATPTLIDVWKDLGVELAHEEVFPPVSLLLKSAHVELALGTGTLVGGGGGVDL